MNQETFKTKYNMKQISKQFAQNQIKNHKAQIVKLKKANYEQGVKLKLIQLYEARIKYCQCLIKSHEKIETQNGLS